MLKYLKVNFHWLNRIYCMDLRVYFKKSFSSVDSNDKKEKKQRSIFIEVWMCVTRQTSIHNKSLILSEIGGEGYTLPVILIEDSHWKPQSAVKQWKRSMKRILLPLEYEKWDLGAKKNVQKHKMNHICFAYGWKRFRNLLVAIIYKQSGLYLHSLKLSAPVHRKLLAAILTCPSLQTCV